MKTSPLLFGWVVPDGRVRLRAAGLVLAIWATASAQTLVEPERVATVRAKFDSAAKATPLRCRINAIHPALDYGLRFHTGYLIDIPMSQFAGAGHSLSTLTRVTPEGLKPEYLESTGTMPEVPATKADAEIGGSFIVGEGTYDVEALVEDDSHRVCHNQWRIQARRSGSERELAPATPPATVQELSIATPVSPDSPAPRIGRLTLMVHAAPFSSGFSNLQPGDVATLVGSLSSLLEQLPARSVRLVVFNLAQRAVLFRQDGFTSKDLEKVITALDQLQLALVDYRTLQQHGGPTDLLADLVQTELRDPQPADALILLGPRLQMPDIPVPAMDRPAAAPSLFYLQYQPPPLSLAGQRPTPARAGGRRPMRPDDPTASLPPSSPLGTSDGIEKLLGTLKGKTIAIRTPHEFADAIWHIEAGIACGADPLVRGRPPGRPARPCVEANLGDPQRDEGVPRGPGGPPHNSTPAPAEASASKPSPTAEPKFTTPAESADTAARPERAAGVPSQTAGPGPLALTLPKLDEPQPDDHSTTDADPVELLMRLRDRVLEHGSRIPNHTCVETIQRDRYEPTAGRANKSCDTLLASRKRSGSPQRLRLETTDRLRLDVAMGPSGEIYSWAGASKFEEGEIDEWIPEGAIGTGPFATHLLAVFENRNPRFVFEGDTELAGRSLMEYSFSVPREESHYRVKARKEWVITGYTGTVLVDPKTAELVRLTVRTEELPPATTDCETDASLDYGTVQLGGDDYLLPKVTHQRFIGRDGEEDENTVTFSACREYQAESKLTFGVSGTVGSVSAATPASAFDLPAGLPVTVELTTSVNVDRFAAGDVIEGRLNKAIRDAHQKTLVPEGAVVHGRLMRVETRHSTPPEFTIALRWESIEVNGVKLPFSLRPDRRPAFNVSGPLRGLRQRGMAIELPQPGEGLYGVYHSRVDHWESGLRTEWLTARP